MCVLFEAVLNGVIRNGLASVCDFISYCWFFQRTQNENGGNPGEDDLLLESTYAMVIMYCIWVNPLLDKPKPFCFKIPEICYLQSKYRNTFLNNGLGL